MSSSGDVHNLSRIPTFTKKHKRPLLILLSTLLLSAVILLATSLTSRSSKHHENAPRISAAHALLRSSCSSTRFPDLCFSSIASKPSLASSLTSVKDVIAASLNLTVVSVEHNYFKVKKLLKRILTPREKAALHDCLVNIDVTLDELRATYRNLEAYSPSMDSISEHADFLKILLSAAMTNQESCLDGFSHEKADKKVRQLLIKGFNHVYSMSSNALAMVCNITGAAVAREMEEKKKKNNWLKERKLEDGFPKWLSAGDRRLLQGDVTPDVTVAADGSGDYMTVSAAVAAAPERSSTRYVIRIKAGVYRENVEVGKTKTNLMFVGDGQSNTIITAYRNVIDGSTTFDSATVAVNGEGFLARDITFQNTAGPSKEQAVALRVSADLSAFYRCGMLAYQDTLYVHSLRQFYRRCYIAGSVDFIFGNAAATLQDCDIHARRPGPSQKNMLTAQGRTDPNQNTGIVIQQCRIGATKDLVEVIDDFPTYLGRPWKEYSRTVVMQTAISDVIQPAGWFPWDGDFALSTLYYAEYQNTGPGADTSQRVTWEGFRVITDASEAEQFTADNFISGSSWLGSTGFPYTLGL